MVCYLDVLLAALRVEVALSPVVMLFGTYGLYLAGELALYCGFRNRVEGTYVQFYEALRTGEGERVQTPAEKSHPWDD